MTNGSAKNEAMIRWERFDLIANIMAIKMAVKSTSIKTMIGKKSSKDLKLSDLE